MDWEKAGKEEGMGCVFGGEITDREGGRQMRRGKESVGGKIKVV